MIAIFMVVCSVGVYAEEVITKVDKEKFEKLTLEQKKELVEMAKEAKSTYLETVKDYNKVGIDAECAREIAAQACCAKHVNTVARDAEKAEKILEKVKEIGDASMKTLEYSPTLEKSKTDERTVTDKEIK